MATFNTNYKATNLTSGTYTGATFYEFLCVVNGSLTILAKEGGKFTWPAVTGSTLQIVSDRVTVVSGAFVGFSPSSNTNWIPYRYSYDDPTFKEYV